MSAMTSSRTTPASPTRRKRPNTGLMGAAVFIVAESTFFIGLFVAYFYLRADVSIPVDQPHPSLLLPLVNTAILAVSVAMTAWAERGIARDDQRRLLIGMTGAAALGLLFMGLQSIEFAQIVQLGFTPTSSAFGSTFYALLVMHVVRVFAGVSFMVIVLIRALLGQFTARRRAAVQACALYWYFIAAVWVVVLGVLYVV
jgi:cytochrome c oxidase subunit III